MTANTDIIDKLTTARVGLLLKAPFFGNMATRLELVDASDWCKRAATDGRRFFYNKDFIKKLSTKKLEFLFGHEILHCALGHFARLGSRNPRLANIAQDYAVNQILVDERIGEKITEVDICYDPKYREWPWEKIYDELYDRAEKISLEDLLKQLGDQLDEHLKEQGDGEGDDGDQDGSGRPRISKEDAQRIRDEIKEAMLQAAASAGAGKTPAGILRLIKDMTEPKMNWRQLVRQEIQSIVRNDYSFSRPNRKGWHSGAILPGLKEDVAIDVAVALDMSGSIGLEDARAFLSEVKGIMDQFQNFTINLWCFDTKIYSHVVITHDNGDDLLSYEPKGGGGTDFMANWEFMKQQGIVPKKFIMMTDGCPISDSWGDAHYCDTLFIVKGNTSAVAPFGQTVIYEKC